MIKAIDPDELIKLVHSIKPKDGNKTKKMKKKVFSDRIPDRLISKQGPFNI